MPVKPVSVEQMVGDAGETSEFVSERIAAEIDIQGERFKNFLFNWNAHIPPDMIEKFCELSKECAPILAEATQKLSPSTVIFCKVPFITSITIVKLSTFEKNDKVQ